MRAEERKGVILLAYDERGRGRRDDRMDQANRSRCVVRCKVSECGETFYGAHTSPVPPDNDDDDYKKREQKARRRRGMGTLGHDKERCQARVLRNYHLEDVHGIEVKWIRRCSEDGCDCLINGASRDQVLDNLEEHLERDHGVVFEDDMPESEPEVQAATA